MTELGIAEDKPRIEHSELPWSWADGEEMRNSKHTIFWAPPGSYAGENMQADAAFIVKAVNRHYELVAALKALRDAIMDGLCNGGTPAYDKEAPARLDAAIVEADRLLENAK